VLSAIKKKKERTVQQTPVPHTVCIPRSLNVDLILGYRSLFNDAETSEQSSSSSSLTLISSVNEAFLIESPCTTQCGDCLQRKPLWSATSPASKSATSPAKSAAAAMECDSADDAKAGDAHADAETDAEADADAEGPPLPVRTDSLHNIEEEALLKAAPWYQAGIPR